jgi:hypothetical protein
MRKINVKARHIHHGQWKTEKQTTKSDPVFFVELKGQIIADHNEGIRSYNELHKSHNLATGV